MIFAIIRIRKFEYINEYVSPSRTGKFEYMNKYIMATHTRLSTQIDQKLAQYWWLVQYLSLITFSSTFDPHSLKSADVFYGRPQGLWIETSKLISLYASQLAHNIERRESFSFTIRRLTDWMLHNGAKNFFLSGTKNFFWLICTVCFCFLKTLFDSWYPFYLIF